MNLQVLLDRYQIKANVNMILDMWNESHRHFHNLDHLNDIISQINESYGNGGITERQRDNLIITALFHDVIYEPTRSDNEEQSANFFFELCQNKDNTDIIEIKEAILDTKTHESSTKLSELFNHFDMNIVERDFNELMKWESGIYEEYKIVGDEKYKEGRIQFLENLLDRYPNNAENISQLIDWVKENY